MHVPATGAVATSAAHAGPAPPVAEDPKDEIDVTPQANPDYQIPVGVPGPGHTIEKVEYHDKDGNPLDEEQVKAMAGKVSFSTRYETRTRHLDANGNELPSAGVAGTIADGENPETPGIPQSEASGKPPKVDVADDLAKEQEIEDSELTAEPESDAGSATDRDEL